MLDDFELELYQCVRDFTSTCNQIAVRKSHEKETQNWKYINVSLYLFIYSERGPVSETNLIGARGKEQEK